MTHYNNNRFPAEGMPLIWLNVFDKLDTADKPAFSRTCDQWHDWVASKRSTFLLKDFAPSLVEGLPKKALLQSRVLCQSWTRELDHQLQIHPFNQCFDFELEARPNHHRKLCIEFSSAEDIQTFMKELENHMGNPFPQRTIELSWDDPVDIAITEMESFELCKAFWESAINLLEKFGMHVWDLTLSFMDSGFIGHILMDHVRNCLLLLPNLKRLEIYGDMDLRPNFESNPTLPQFEHMKTLMIISCHNEFTDAVLSSCCVETNITRVFITDIPRFCSRFDPVYNFNNLQVLETDLSIEALEGFRFLAQLPPIREICFSLTNLEPIYAPRIFNALQPFENSLLNLHIVSEVVLSDEDRTAMKINLPNLKRLKCSQWEGSLDPIIQLKTINYLKISALCTPINQRKGNLLEFYGIEKHMYKSNIWNLMPSLESLDVEIFLNFFKFFHRYFFNKRQIKARYESGSVIHKNGTVDAYSQTND